MESKGFYKTCFVPKCENTQKKFRDKVFINVPYDETRRKAWFQAAHRSDSNAPNLKSSIHCCEDHFDVSVIKF